MALALKKRPKPWKLLEEEGPRHHEEVDVTTRVSGGRRQEH